MRWEHVYRGAVPARIRCQLQNSVLLLDVSTLPLPYEAASHANVHLAVRRHLSYSLTHFLHPIRRIVHSRTATTLVTNSLSLSLSFLHLSLCAACLPALLLRRQVGLSFFLSFLCVCVHCRFVYRLYRRCIIACLHCAFDSHLMAKSSLLLIHFH